MYSTTVNLANNYPPISAEVILELFQQFRSSNNEQVQNASKQLMFYQENFPGDVLIIVSGFLLDDSHEDYIFQFSAIYINRVLSPTLYVLEANSRTSFWKHMDENQRSLVKQGTFRGLMFSNPTVRNLCAKAISLIAKIEVKNSNYPDLFDNIFQIILNDQYGEWSKLGGIQAITELLLIHTKKDPVIPKEANFEEIGSNIFQITTTVLQNQQTSAEFKNEAANCMRISLPYFASCIQDQFGQLLEFILSILPIGLSAYKLLLKFCKTFYSQLVPDPIKRVFEEVSKDITSTDCKRKILALNFWHSFSKHEFKILIRNPAIFQNISNQLSEAFSHPFLDILPNAVKESDINLFEEANEDDLSDLIICCLKQFAQIPQNQEIIANNVVNFYQQYHSNEESINRYSSILSLLSIVFINTQPQLTDFFIKNINILIDLISNDPSINVRCLSIKLLGKIFVHQVNPESNELFSQLIDFSTALLNGNDTTILASVCKMLSAIFNRCNTGFILHLFNNNYLSFLITLLDRPNIFQDPFYRFLQKTFDSYLNSSPDSNSEIFSIYANLYIEVGTRFEKALKEAEFPDQNCKELMISLLCSIIINICKKFKYIPYDSTENFANITSHLLDILFESITTFPDMCEFDILGVIAALVVVDPAKVIQNRLDQVSQIIINIYTTSDSMQIIKIAGNIARDLIFLYPDYFKQITASSNGEQERSLANQLLDFTLKCFNTILFIPFQVWIFGVIGDIISIVDDSEYIYANEIISGLNYLRYMIIPKTDIESNIVKISSMLYVSQNLIAKYRNYDAKFYRKFKGPLFATALDVAKNQYQDQSIIKRYFEFLDEVLRLPKEYFKVFSVFITREEIKSSLKNMVKPFKKKADNVLVKINRKTNDY